MSVKRYTGLCPSPEAIHTASSAVIFGMFEISDVSYKSMQKACKQFSVVSKLWSMVLFYPHSLAWRLLGHSNSLIFFVKITSSLLLCSHAPSKYSGILLGSIVISL